MATNSTVASSVSAAFKVVMMALLACFASRVVTALPRASVNCLTTSRWPFRVAITKGVGRPWLMVLSICRIRSLRCSSGHVCIRLSSSSTTSACPFSAATNSGDGRIPLLPVRKARLVRRWSLSARKPRNQLTRPRRQALRTGDSSCGARTAGGSNVVVNTDCEPLLISIRFTLLF